MSRKTTVTPTVETVKAAIGRTWFDVSDEDSFINIESRDHGDVGSETPGKEDVKEGQRLLDLLRKAFPPSKWATKFEVVDEWVTVSLRVAPLSKVERDKLARERKVSRLRAELGAVVAAANDETKKDGYRLSFSAHVHEGDYFKKVTIKAVFGERFLYPNHLGARFLLVNEIEADEALQPLVKKFSGLTWSKTIREPTPRRTGNCPPPHNIIENEGYVEYEADTRNI